MTAAAKNGPSGPPDRGDDEDITIERLVKLPPEAMAYGACLTTRINRIDSRLLAIARGEIEPEDPFGGLIPIYETEEDSAHEVDEAWLSLEASLGPELEPAKDMFCQTVPKLRMQVHQLMGLPIDARTGFFASQIDGKRNIEELIDVCASDDLEALELIDELLRLGAIELG